MKILVCVDGSEQSKRAVMEAAKLAECIRGSEVTVLHVMVNLYQHTSTWMLENMASQRKLEAIEKYMQEENATILKEALAIFSEKNIPAKTMSRTGHTAIAIEKAADEGDFDLVVIGSRGLGGLKKLVLGSVSNAVVQQVRTNVLIVR